MKITVACVLIVVSMASSEPPRYRSDRFSQQRQNSEASPYNSSGWKPSGPQFNTPERSTFQQSYPSSNLEQAYSQPLQPQPSYEIPVEEPDKRNSTTTEASTKKEITENPQAENINIDSKAGKVRIPSEESPQSSQPEKYFFFVPRLQEQSQNLVFQGAALKETTAPVIPVSQVYEFPIKVPQKAAALVSVDASPLRIQRIVPVTSFFKDELYSPFTSSFVQVFQ